LGNLLRTVLLSLVVCNIVLQRAGVDHGTDVILDNHFYNDLLPPVSDTYY
jgi:hypothetical protein